MLNEMLLKAIEDMVRYSANGITATDVFDRRTGMSIGGVHTNPMACAMFNHIYDDLQSAASASHLLGDLDMLILAEKGSGGGVIVVVAVTPRYRIGMHVDTHRCSLGMLLGVVFTDKMPSIRMRLPVEADPEDETLSVL